MSSVKQSNTHRKLTLATAELHQTQSQTTVTTLSIATNDPWKFFRRI